MTSPSVVVFDYGSGNLRSAARALTRAGASVTVTADPDQALACDGLVVPGVGAFAACVRGLTAAGGMDLLARRAAAGRPVLGICVGMQVLFERGLEHGFGCAGAGLWPGTVRRLRVGEVGAGGLPLPHLGWNTVDAAPGSVLLRGLDPGTRFYFVHSYAVCDPVPGPVRMSWAEHGERFVAAIESDDGVLRATQFHPEKSGDAGHVLLRNWVEVLK